MTGQGEAQPVVAFENLGLQRRHADILPIERDPRARGIRIDGNVCPQGSEGNVDRLALAQTAHLETH